MSNNFACTISPVPELIEEIKNGRMIILVDDEDRENEGDLVCAAEFVTPDMINFMAKKIITNMTLRQCLPMFWGLFMKIIYHIVYRSQKKGLQ